MTGKVRKSRSGILSYLVSSVSGHDLSNSLGLVEDVGRAADGLSGIAAAVDGLAGGALERRGFLTAVIPDKASGRRRFMTPVQIGRAVLTGTGVDLDRLVGLQDERREPVDMTCLIAQRPVGHRDRFAG